MKTWIQLSLLIFTFAPSIQALESEFLPELPTKSIITVKNEVIILPNTYHTKLGTMVVSSETKNEETMKHVKVPGPYPGSYKYEYIKVPVSVTETKTLDCLLVHNSDPGIRKISANTELHVAVPWLRNFGSYENPEWISLTKGSEKGHLLLDLYVATAGETRLVIECALIFEKTYPTSTSKWLYKNAEEIRTEDFRSIAEVDSAPPSEVP